MPYTETDRAALSELARGVRDALAAETALDTRLEEMNERCSALSQQLDELDARLGELRCSPVQTALFKVTGRYKATDERLDRLCQETFRQLEDCRRDRDALLEEKEAAAHTLAAAEDGYTRALCDAVYALTEHKHPAAGELVDQMGLLSEHGRVWLEQTERFDRLDAAEEQLYGLLEHLCPLDDAARAAAQNPFARDDAALTEQFEAMTRQARQVLETAEGLELELPFDKDVDALLVRDGNGAIRWRLFAEAMQTLALAVQDSYNRLVGQLDDCNSRIQNALTRQRECRETLCRLLLEIR